MITEIEKKLQKMDKSQILKICRKMKCPTGTKREMIRNLLRPFINKKYGMSSDEEEYIYSEEEYSDYDELSDNEETILDCINRRYTFFIDDTKISSNLEFMVILSEFNNN